MINRPQEKIISNWTQGDTDNPMVSVLCLSYNHASSLSRALDSFLMQETNFSFEIIIHDDASTDGSAAVIKEYEEKYPQIVKPIYQKENQYSQGVKIFKTHVYPKAKGKYHAYCEGDDYWTSPEKLQCQFDVMEEHPEYSMCVHNTVCHFEDTSKKDRLFTRLYVDHVMDEKELFFGWNVHTSSYFCRVYSDDTFDSLSPYWFGDYIILTTSYFYGPVYYLKSVMSVYNKNASGETMSRWTGDTIKRIYDDRLRIQYLREYNELTNYRYDEIVSKRIRLIERECNEEEFNYYIMMFNDAEREGKRKGEMKELAKKITEHPNFKTFVEKKRGIKKVKRLLKYKYHSVV